MWVVLIAGSTGSALRAVSPPNLHTTPGLRKSGYLAVCYAAYAMSSYQRGDIVSRHRSIDAAAKRAGPGGWLSWREVPLQGPLD